MYWAQPKRALDVNLCHECAPAEAHDRIDGIRHCGVVHCGVVQAEVAYVNAIVDAAPWGVGKVHNEAPFP